MNLFRYDILINIETSDMKTIYFAIAGLAGLAAAVYYFRFGNRLKGISTYENLKKRPAYGEKHLRGIMKKSKHAL
jgi:myosin-crossreactive antigen